MSVNIEYNIKFEYQFFSKIMKKLLAILFIFSFCSATFAGNEGYKIKIKINGLKDTTCYLGNYYGNKQYYKDTARVDGNGVCVFEGEESLPGGIYTLIYNNTMLFEIIVNEPVIELETDTTNYVKKLVVKKSAENKLFYEHLFFITEKQRSIQLLQGKMEKADEDGKKKLREDITAISNEIKDFRLGIIEKNPNTLVASIFNAMKEPEVPNFETEKNDSIVRYLQYKYIKDNYWDGFDFSDERLIRTPIYHNKLDRYLNKIVFQRPDSINKEADWILKQTKPETELFKYTVHYVTNTFEKSKIMGMDAVFVHMAQNYYTHELAFWVDSAQVEKIQDRAKALAPLLVGKVTPNLKLLDTASVNWVNLHKLEADYTILVFWDPECGHCKKELPKMAEYYETIRDQNILVYAVSSDHNDAWKKFIRDNKMDFINVAVPQEVYKDQQKVNEYVLTGKTDVASLNYSATYDIYSTPQVYLLDKDKKIIGKKLDTDLLKQVFENQYNIKGKE
ncbi:redoxin domain-containing protein [Vicingus serpentipes]|jgi:peroxiredoxin|uniref:Redoxin domain-containing protein n=2 Tax=Vicingus serpentipes TaxID=1926625 RepID=A0A5C6RXG1_9FLAO|nr:redoxin domain-containing protein [Vicingus serpentipes]